MSLKFKEFLGVSLQNKTKKRHKSSVGSWELLSSLLNNCFTALPEVKTTGIKIKLEPFVGNI